MTQESQSAHISQPDFEALLKKIEALKKAGSIDLSAEEDLSIAVMNLISLEEHFFFTAERTHKPEYFTALDETREVRKDLLGRLIDRHEGETWCAVKHLLAAAMRLIEVGTKLHAEKKTDEAEKIFSYAYRLYTLFWGLRLKLVSIPDLKTMAAAEKDKKPWTLEDIVNKLVDCCDE